MKLTKLQRYTAYCIFYHESKNKKWAYKNYGLCHLINETCDLVNIGFPKDTMLRSYDDIIRLYFPELNDKKLNIGWPNRDDEGWKWRTEKLKQCISETEPK